MILELAVSCNKIRCTNSREPQLVTSCSYPGYLENVDLLFQQLSVNLSAASTSVNMFRDVAEYGNIHLQALGIDINIQVNSEDF